MAKLTNTPANPIIAPNIPVPLAQPSGFVQSAAPRSFAIVAPNQSTKAPRKAKAATEAKVPRVTGEAWFADNFSGQITDVLQQRKYPSRKEGFHCAPCGIAGSSAIIIRGKDGKGTAITIYKQDPTTRELVEDFVVNGFMVGATCLKKYGKIDIDKVNLTANQALAKAAPPAE